MSFPLRIPHFEIPEGSINRTHTDVPLQESGRDMQNASRTYGAENLGSRLRPNDLTLISSLHGKIERLLITLAQSVFASTGGAYRDSYKQLIQSLPEYTQIEIVVRSSDEAAARRLLTDAGRPSGFTIHPFDDEINFTIWAEDAYTTAVSDGGTGSTYFVEPFLFRRYADGVIADFVSHATDIGNTSAPLYFQGGNILIGDDFFLVGMDYPQNTLNRRLLRVPQDADAIWFMKKSYEKYLDSNRSVYFPTTSREVPQLTFQLNFETGIPIVEVLYRGVGNLQPIFHIDMFISLLGRTPSGEYELMVGDPSLAEDLLGHSYGVRSLSSFFNQVADDLSASGFEIVRNPLALAFYDWTTRGGSPLPLAQFHQLVRDLYGDRSATAMRDALIADGHREGVLREWYFATSNNVISEEDGERKTVWLPQYGFGSFSDLRVVDEENQNLWESRGFTVRGLGDFHAFANNLGAAHCITKYLGRSD